MHRRVRWCRCRVNKDIRFQNLQMAILSVHHFHVELRISFSPFVHPTNPIPCPVSSSSPFSHLAHEFDEFQFQLALVNSAFRWTLQIDAFVNTLVLSRRKWLWLWQVWEFALKENSCTRIWWRGRACNSTPNQIRSNEMTRDCKLIFNYLKIDYKFTAAS